MATPYPNTIKLENATIIAQTISSSFLTSSLVTSVSSTIFGDGDGDSLFSDDLQWF
jgi:hypothetical protein